MPYGWGVIEEINDAEDEMTSLRRQMLEAFGRASAAAIDREIMNIMAQEDQQASQERENLDSVEISRTAKGEVSFKVKCYATTTAEASERARATYDSLSLKFPPPKAG